MTEKDRIIELVKAGVLTTKEALDLIEGLARKEGEKSANRDFASSGSKEEAEAGIEAAASDMLVKSERIDSLNDQIQELESDLSDLQAELEEAEANQEEDLLKNLRQDFKDLHVEKDLIKDLDEVDNSKELDQINEEIKDLESHIQDQEVISQDKQAEIKELRSQLVALSKEIARLVKERDSLVKEVDGSDSQWFTDRLENLKDQFQFSEDWKEETSKKVNQAGENINKVVKDIVGSSKDFLDHFEWHKPDLRVFNLVSNSFNKEWQIEDSQPTIFDIKNANGDLVIQEGPVAHIEIKASITMFGKFNSSLEEAFEKRSTYRLTEDSLKLHIPNKRVQADIQITLPEGSYDYLSVNVLNGDLSLKDLTFSDLYLKATKGDISLDQVKASMVEVKGTSGDIKVLDSDLQDLIISSVNGDIKADGRLASSSLATTLGDIRLSLYGPSPVQVDTSTVYGDVKIALPLDKDLEVEGKSNFGKVYSRLSQTKIEASDGKDSSVTFSRLGQGQAIRVKAKTTQGNILLKDSE
ncbi:DUF4097 family beta strand repeat-containing protein [Alloiococcus otitis]|uniref:DUF4097 family beta strand repeat-containing protein n=1 Tax=Alloiococcus otitis TaxID=1652 RepID=UPI002353723D|nr:DUF4097 family beta strand repeat-containing protein [Alloiococcus otitis]